MHVCVSASGSQEFLMSTGFRHATLLQRVAQRAYESNSKAVTTSDSMLGTAISMKR